MKKPRLIHRLQSGASYLDCGLYFLPAPLKHSNVPPIPVPKGVARMSMRDFWVRELVDPRLISYECHVEVCPDCVFGTSARPK